MTERKTLKTALLVSLMSSGLLLQSCAVQAGSAPYSAGPALQSSASTPAQPGIPPVVQADPNIFVNLSRKVMPSVVNISTLAAPSPGRRIQRPDDLFRQFFGDRYPEYFERGPRELPQGKPQLRPLSLGTGFVIDDSGIILTNNHVIDGADRIQVRFTESPTEKPTPAEVIGTDPELDIALLKVSKSEKLTPLPLGDSEALQVGEYVVAVGNPFGQGHSLTHGIISAKGRPAPDFPLATYLQTDAPINPGNSGGPLINLKGEVIGINNAIDARAQGIGFAIPINSVKRVLGQLQTKGTVARGYLGVGIGELTPDIAEQIGAKGIEAAPMIVHVEPRGPAAQAGVKPYDVVLEVDGKAVRTHGELTQAVTSVPVGSRARLTILREGKKKQIEVKLGERPSVRQVARR